MSQWLEKMTVCTEQGDVLLTDSGDDNYLGSLCFPRLLLNSRDHGLPEFPSYKLHSSPRLPPKMIEHIQSESRLSLGYIGYYAFKVEDIRRLDINFVIDTPDYPKITIEEFIGEKNTELYMKIISSLGDFVVFWYNP